jgi:hypothetical protein
MAQWAHDVGVRKYAIPYAKDREAFDEAIA